MLHNHKWIEDIENAIRSGSADKRTDSLRQVTSLFLASHEAFSERQIEVFDHVLSRLIEKIETRALEELSQKLAPISNAPNDIVQKLARSDNINVAGPMLRLSTRLTVDDLTEVARSKGQDHLFAISERVHVAASVSDILISRGNESVLDNLLNNKGAEISEGGFQQLVDKAEKNESLAEQIGRRLDIPLKLFRELLERATEAVREKLKGLMNLEEREQIEKAIAKIADQVVVEEAAPRDFTVALSELNVVKKNGELTPQLLLSYVRSNRYEHLVVGLSLLSAVSVDILDKLMHSENPGGLLIPLKAAGVDRNAAKLILKNRPFWKVLSDDELQEILSDYVRLSKATAERISRFWSVRAKIK